MGARLGQNPNTSRNPWSVSVIVKRGVQVVNLVDERPRILPFTDGIGQIAWTFLLPANAPVSGAWAFFCPILSELDDQYIGTAEHNGSIYPAYLATGVISTTAPLAPGSKVTFRGLVT